MNCWLRLRPHQWQGWKREDTWLNMYPYNDPMPIGILANRCGRCVMIKLREVYGPQAHGEALGAHVSTD